jgi:hypothetical protein
LASAEQRRNHHFVASSTGRRSLDVVVVAAVVVEKLVAVVVSVAADSSVEVHIGCGWADSDSTYTKVPHTLLLRYDIVALDPNFWETLFVVVAVFAVVVVAVVVVDDIDVNAGEELELLEETVSIGSEHFLSISELELTMAEVVEKSVGKNNF